VGAVRQHRSVVVAAVAVAAVALDAPPAAAAPARVTVHRRWRQPAAR
jgi:hypothetical protein